MTYLLLDAGDHDALPAYSTVLLGFLLPVTALTVVLLSARQVRLNDAA